MSVRLGVVGCGSVFWTPYMGLIEKLRGQGRVEVVAVYDSDPEKRRAAAARLDLTPDLPDDAAVCAHPDVDVVLVLTSMTEHGRLARAALEAGKHVLVEKPVATSLDEAEAVLAAAADAPGHLLCAPHILLSPTYREMHARVRAGEIGGLLTARGRYGWAGPDWGRWFYEPGGGALFDLGVYNVTSLCGFFGPARRVTAMTGAAIPVREVNGEPVQVQVEDNAHVLIDFGDARFAVVTTGFTMQTYRSPCLELYGTHGVVQMLGDDWAPEGFELYRNDAAVWEVHPESDPTWPWTDGLRHLVECLETGTEPVTRPEHAYHALEIMLAAQAAGADGMARDDRERLPGARPRPARRSRPPRARARSAERVVTLVERMPPPASSPRPVFDGPALVRRADVTRHVWGEPASGRGVRLDLRLDRARPHARLRPVARRVVPPLGGLPHDLRGRRGAPRAAGHARDRRPGARRGPAGRGGGERVLPPRHLASRVRAGAGAAARARAVRPAARGGGVERLRARPAVPRDAPLRGRRAARRVAARSAARRRACASCAPPTCSTGATSACSAGSSPARST